MTLVIAPFRRPTFRKALSPLYPVEEPWDSAPLVIAGAMEAAGFDVRYLPLLNIFDGFDETRDVAALKELLSPGALDAVIFASDSNIASRSTAAVYGIRLMAEILAANNPRPVLAVTGRLATAAAAQLLRDIPSLDFVIVGEADLVIARAVDLLLRDGPLALDDEASVLTRRKLRHGAEGAIVPALVEDLNTLPLPAWRLVAPAIGYYRRQHPGWSHPIPMSLRTSVGCIYQCKFCAGIPNWRAYRTKSAERVSQEVDGLISLGQGNARLSFLEDEIFTLENEHVRQVSSVMVERSLRLDGVYTHSRLLDDANTGPLAAMTGRVLLGLDNPDDGGLRRMGKGQTVGHVMDAVEVARRAQLLVHLEWIIGSPEDTVDTLISSLVAMFNLLATGAVRSLNSYVYCPHPGTDYERNSQRHGIQILERLEDIQESGGFPASATDKLTRNQVFTAYLMSQTIVAELGSLRKRHLATDVVSPNRRELKRLFQRVGGDV